MAYLPRVVEVSRRRWYVALPLTLLFVAAVLAQVSGGSIDPTDPANYNKSALVNDSGHPLVVRLCRDSRCKHFISELGWEQIPPGAREVVQVAWGGRDPAVYLVKTGPQGETVGCVRLLARKNSVETAGVPLTSAVPCRE